MCFGGYHLMFYYIRCPSALCADTIVVCSVFNIVFRILMGVLLNRAPTSIHLHPAYFNLHLAPPSLFQPPPNSLQHPQCYQNQNRTYLGNFPKCRPKILKLSILIENWKIWCIGGADSESRLFGQISTRKVEEVLVLFENWHILLLKDAGSYSSISFLNLGPQNPFLGKFGPKKSNLLFLLENRHNWYLEDVDSYSNIILNFQLKIHFLAERYSGGFGTVYADQNQTKINREYTTKNVA